MGIFEMSHRTKKRLHLNPGLQEKPLSLEERIKRAEGEPGSRHLTLDDISETTYPLSAVKERARTQGYTEREIKEHIAERHRKIISRE